MMEPMNTLLTGRSDGGSIAVVIPHATWDQVRAVADSLQAASVLPIEWSTFDTEATDVNAALGERSQAQLVPA